MKKRHSWGRNSVFTSVLTLNGFVLFLSVTAMTPDQSGVNQTPPPPAESGTTTQQPSPQPTPATTTQEPNGQQGPDTVGDVEKTGIQGNWVKKREWLTNATTVNNQIQELAAQNEPIRKTFIEKYKQSESVLDAYYATNGVQQGQLQELFDSIQRYVDKKRQRDLSPLGIPTTEKPDAELQAKIDTIEASLKESKHQLEQLKLDMKSIEDLDRSLHDRFKRLDEYCNTIQEDANRAKAIVNDLWNIVDHNIARDRYYELNNNILEKIKNTQSFLQNEFSKDFESVIATINDQIAKTESSIKTLEAKGFIIKNRTQRVKELKLKESQQERDGLEKSKQLATKEPAAQTLSERIVNNFFRMVTSITDGWLWIKTKISGLWTRGQTPSDTQKIVAAQAAPSMQQTPTPVPTHQPQSPDQVQPTLPTEQTPIVPTQPIVPNPAQEPSQNQPLATPATMPLN